MKRQPKPFVVEIKRSSRKAPVLPTPPIWDVAALLSSAESDAHAKPSQIAASALFRAMETADGGSSAVPERRILQSLAVETDTDVIEVEPPPVRTRTRAPITVKPVEPAPLPAEPEIEYIEFDTIEPMAFQPLGFKEERPSASPRSEAENVFSFMPDAAASLDARPNRLSRERDLPRGERWKRRLPKIMR